MRCLYLFDTLSALTRHFTKFLIEDISYHNKPSLLHERKSKSYVGITVQDLADEYFCILCKILGAICCVLYCTTYIRIAPSRNKC